MKKEKKRKKLRERQLSLQSKHTKNLLSDAVNEDMRSAKELERERESGRRRKKKKRERRKWFTGRSTHPKA